MSMHTICSDSAAHSLESRRRTAPRKPPMSRAVPSTRTLEWAALLIIALLLLVGLVSTSGRQASMPFQSQSLKVQTGDTLWTLAAQHPVEGMSTAEVADMLAKENGLAGCSLVPGQVIVVPSGPCERRLAAK